MHDNKRMLSCKCTSKVCGLCSGRIARIDNACKKGVMQQKAQVSSNFLELIDSHLKKESLSFRNKWNLRCVAEMVPN